MLLLAILITVGAVPARAASTESFFSWKINRNYQAFTSVAWGDGRYIAAGGLVGLWTSIDGEAWDLIPGTEEVAAEHLLYFNGRFLVAGVSGISQLLNDSHLEPVLPDVNIRHLYKSGGQLLASSNEGWYASSDGLEWEPFFPNEATWLHYQNEIWAGFAFNSTTILRSTDGSEWVSTQSPEGAKVVALGAGGGLFVAVTEESFDQAYAVFTSKDAKTWTRSALTLGDVPTVGQSDDRLLLIADRALYTSIDGVEWEGRSLPFYAPVTRLTFADDRFMISTFSGALFQSADGSHWRRMATEPRGLLTGVAFGNGAWVAVGENGALLFSRDGQRWQVTQSGVLTDFRAVSWAGGQFVATTAPVDGYACYEQGDCLSLVYTSKDGLNWQWSELESPGLVSVVWGAGRYVGVDFSEQAYWSKDGLAWQKAGKAAGYLGTIAARDGVILSTGFHDGKQRLYRSTDGGESWQESPLPDETLPPGSLRLLNDRFVLIGSKAVYYSLDGASWGVRPKYGPSIGPVAAGGPWYVGVTWFSQTDGYGLTYSPDGAIWVQTVRVPLWLNAVAYGDGRFVGVGDGGAIVSWQIDPAEATPCRTSFTDLPTDLCPVLKWGLERKAVGGYPDGTFRPDRGITRAEFAKMLGGAFYWEPEPQGTLSFTDTESHWAVAGGFLQPAARRGALSGFPDGTFQPDAPLTIAQLLKVSLAAYGLKPANGPGKTGLPATEWYAGWVAKAQEVNVYGPAAKYPLWASGPFDPNRPATRAEAVTVLFNLMHAGLK